MTYKVTPWKLKAGATLAARHRGDRVRIDAGRVVELAWPTWPHGTPANEQRKLPPDGWFAREIVDLFGGEARADLEWLPSMTPVAEVVRDWTAHDGGDDGGARGGDHDPLLAGTPRRGRQGGLW